MTKKFIKSSRYTFSRIMIFGRPGSGKSTFAYALHKSINLPLHHLDKHFFTKNWVERDTQEFLRIQQSIVDEDLWIIDGNSIKSLEMRYARADLVLHFNYPRWICYWRVFKRIFDKNLEIDDRAECCPERASWKLLKYMWGYEKRVEEPIAYLKDKYPNVPFVEISNDRELNTFERDLIDCEEVG
jgi:adenylate kinase family enzyme